MRTGMTQLLRAFPGRSSKRRPWIQRKPQEKWPLVVLILDTETTTDPTQRLLFGGYQYCEWDEETLTTVEEGLFHADDLEERDAEAFRVLRSYARSHRISLLSRRSFMGDVFWPLAYCAHGMVVGFNLPFDLSRLAVRHGSARKNARGGFSFVLWDYFDKATGEREPHSYRPRLTIKHIDSKRAFIRFGSAREIPKEHRTLGRFLDLRTLAFALTDKNHSLASACEAYNAPVGKVSTEVHGTVSPEYIDYNRQDVEATKSLLIALRKEFDGYPVDLDPCRAFSPASLAKACLRAMGIRPLLSRFKNVSDEVLGWSMTAYYGGRSEVRIRRALVPIVLVDFISMYPTVNCLMGHWAFVVAQEIEVVDDTARVQELLERVDLNCCFTPEAWPQFMFLAEVLPDRDTLPVRSRYDGRNPNIGVNSLSSDRPVWYTGPDLVASKLLTGRAPTVLRAVTLKPSGTIDGLSKIDLDYGITINPAEGDVFRQLIELRKSLERYGIEPAQAVRIEQLLKTIANSGAYGILAQMQVVARTKDEPFVVHGLETFESDSDRSDEVREFTFPYLAALTTGGARLMLAILESAVAEKGGTYAFCDTDSMAIVATEEGGPIEVADEIIRALSWSEVNEIRARFADLNPYDPDIVGPTILKLEDENFENP